MIRMFLVSTALAMTAPALAQTAPADPAMPGQEMPMPAQPGTAPDAAAAQPAQPSSPTNAVAAIVETEYPAYDANKDGQLDKAEFSRWMVALKDQEMKATGQTLPPEQVTAWVNGAFGTADADKSMSVSKPELIAYLSGGANG